MCTVFGILHRMCVAFLFMVTFFDRENLFQWKVFLSFTFYLEVYYKMNILNPITDHKLRLHKKYLIYKWKQSSQLFYYLQFKVISESQIKRKFWRIKKMLGKILFVVQFNLKCRREFFFLFFRFFPLSLICL